MGTKDNKEECLLYGKWYLKEISPRKDKQWRTERSFEDDEVMMTFEDGFLTAIVNGKVVCHASYQYIESAALLNLDGSKFDRELACFSRMSEQYRAYFEGSDELFLYSTEPGTDDALGFQRYRLVRGE